MPYIKQCSRCGCDLVPASFLGLQYHICPYCKGNRYRFSIKIVMTLYILVVFTTAAIVANNAHLRNIAIDNAKEAQAKQQVAKTEREERSNYSLPEYEIMSKCASLLNSKAIVDHVNLYEDSAHAYVDRSYYLLDYTGKKGLLACVHWYYSQRNDMFIDAYVTDIYSNENLSSWTYYGGMDIDK